jgi:small subunit ribosomal protein S17
MEGRKKRRTGTVVSNKMDKTVVLLTHRMTKHPLYKKYIKKRVRFKAHDQNNSCQVGDTVLVQEARPLSKDKRWKVVKILEKAI